MTSFNHQEPIPGKVVWLKFKTPMPIKIKMCCQSNSEVQTALGLSHTYLACTLSEKNSKGRTFVFHRTDSSWTGYCHSGVTALALQLPGSNYTAWVPNKKLHSCVELGRLKMYPM